MTPRIIVSRTRMARVRPSTITILKPSRILLPLVVVRAERWLPRAAGRWRDGEAVVKRLLLLLLLLQLILISWAPPERRSRRKRPAECAHWRRGACRGARTALLKIPRARSTPDNPRGGK